MNNPAMALYDFVSDYAQHIDPQGKRFRVDCGECENTLFEGDTLMQVYNWAKRYAYTDYLQHVDSLETYELYDMPCHWCAYMNS